MNEKPPMPTKFTVGEFGKKDQMNVKQPSSTKAMQLQQQKRREEIDQEWLGSASIFTKQGDCLLKSARAHLQCRR